MNKHPIVIAIDGTSASGKSTNAKLVAKALGYVYVDTGAMYRTLAWYCLQKRVDVHDEKAVATLCRKWNTSLECVDNQVHLLVDGKYPAREIRAAETSGAVSQVAAVKKVRDWMKKTQRDCIQFGNLVMEGRDIGTNVFPETDFKFYLDAALDERSKRRAAEGVQENLAARDQRDSQRAEAPLMVALGAKTINTSHMTTAQTSGLIIDEVRKRLAVGEMNPVYFIGWTFYRTTFAVYFRWRVYNNERVPLKGAVILASNHASFLDPPLVGSGLKRDINYLARKSLFRVPGLGWILRTVNAVPVDRDGGGAAGLKAIMDRLHDGGAIILFPEGTRTSDGKLQPARSGIGLTVIKSDAPVIPVRVFGTYEAWGRNVRFPKPRRVSLKYGRPMNFEKLRAEAKECSKPRLKEIYQEVADEIMATIAKLEPHEDKE